VSRVRRLQTVGYRLAIEASWTCLGWPWHLWCQKWVGFLIIFLDQEP